MKKRHVYRVKEAAGISGLSVRTLHYYDEIGLLVPKERTPMGYRLYDRDDLLRLQQVLVGRELGLSLEEIRRFLDDPNFDYRRALLAQKAQLQKRAQLAQTMIRAIDVALTLLKAHDTGEIMDIKKIFDGFDPSQYEEEARQRWGSTDAHKESQRRASRYGDKEWEKYKVEQEIIYSDTTQALQSGIKPEDPRAMAIADRHRLLIDRWFYPCSKAMHCSLADLYESDTRFAESIDRHAMGLAVFLAAAIRANAAGN